MEGMLFYQTYLEACAPSAYISRTHRLTQVATPIQYLGVASNLLRLV